MGISERIGWGLIGLLMLGAGFVFIYVASFAGSALQTQSAPVAWNQWFGFFCSVVLGLSAGFIGLWLIDRAITDRGLLD